MCKFSDSCLLTQYCWGRSSLWCNSWTWTTDGTRRPGCTCRWCASRSRNRCSRLERKEENKQLRKHSADTDKHSGVGEIQSTPNCSTKTSTTDRLHAGDGWRSIRFQAARFHSPKAKSAKQFQYFCDGVIIKQWLAETSEINHRQPQGWTPQFCDIQCWQITYYHVIHYCNLTTSSTTCHKILNQLMTHPNNVAHYKRKQTAICVSLRLETQSLFSLHLVSIKDYCGLLYFMCRKQHICLSVSQQCYATEIL